MFDAKLFTAILLTAGFSDLILEAFECSACQAAGDIALADSAFCHHADRQRIGLCYLVQVCKSVLDTYALGPWY